MPVVPTSQEMNTPGGLERFGKGFLRSFAAAVRGYAEAKVQLKQARGQREAQMAQVQLNQRKVELAEQRNNILGLEHNLDVEKWEDQKKTDASAEQAAIDKANQTADEKKEAEEAKAKAIKNLGDQYDKETQVYFDEREKYNAETDPVEKQKLRASLIRRGSWLESNAKQVGRTFDAHTRFIESDEEIREEALEEERKATELQRKQKAIQDSKVLTPEQKKLAHDQLEIDPNFNILESIETERAATAEATENTQATAEAEAKKQEIRDAKHKLLDEHSETIIKKYGQGVFDALKVAIESEDDPNDVDVLKYLEPLEAADDKKTDPDITAIIAGLPEGIRRSISRISANSIFSTREKKLEWATHLKNELSLGNRDIVLRMLGDKIRDITKTTDKFMGSRVPIAKQLVNIQKGMSELDKMGVKTGRMFSRYIEGMSLADWKAAVGQVTIEFSGIEKLDPEQKRKATAVATQINASLAFLLQKVSGAAVQEAEFERWRAMLPALFKDDDINTGTIDGFLTVLRTDQEAAYAQYVPADIAKEMMTTEGWGEIKTTEDKRKEMAEQTASNNKVWQGKTQDEKFASAVTVIDKFEDRKIRIARLVQVYGIIEEEAKQLLDDFHKLEDTEKEKARELREKMRNE